MIYTVTLNPSIDHLIGISDLKIGGMNRAVSEQMRAGGKGINVSIMLSNLGMKSVALGFTAGFTGEEIRRSVRSLGIEERFIQLTEGISRINTKLRTSEETEINGTGPVIVPEAVNALMSELDKLQNGDVLIMSGSIPRGVPVSIYADMIGRVADKDILTVVDASGELLEQVLTCSPFLVKPNAYELAELTGIDAAGGSEEMIKGAEELIAKGARNVIVSMGAGGAVMVTSDGEIFVREAPAITPVNTVGAGDSMVAGFLYRYLNGAGKEDAFRTAVAAGSASAAKEGFATIEEIRRYEEG